MARDLHSATVVVTGASSGIGHATARRFAAEGASVALLARRSHALAELASQISADGGRALALPVDMTDAEAVEVAARRVRAELGGPEVWVNNAGVSLFARLEEAPLEVYRRVIDVNLMGYVHGARAAIPLFRERGGGVLINNSSVLGEIGAPYLSAYVASKWAIRGWSESVRMEQRDDGIDVCTVLPGSIDTPIFQHAANYTGRSVKALDPVISADRVADAIVSLARRPRREAVVGFAARVQAKQHRFTPRIAERTFAKQVERDHFGDDPAPPTAGAVLEPADEHARADGGWKQRNGRGRGRATAAAAAVIAAAGVAAAAAIKRGSLPSPFRRS
jgi:short-subunit dehydrogenase